jgi:phosphoenolpyruvate-protein phosphotransferase (PTS system enzyme I)
MTALVLTGSAASRGIALGTARLLEGNDFETPEFHLASTDLPAEIDRYRNAVFDARMTLKDMSDGIKGQLAHEVKEFLDAHLLMMEDAALAEGPVEFIRSRSINAEWALKMTREQLLDVFAAMEDDYFKSRSDDVNQVVGRIMAALVNRGGRLNEDEKADSLLDRVIVADELEPAELTHMAERGAVGFISETGGPLSHASIIARSLGLPYIAGIKGARQMINEGAMLILDGERGIVLIEPDAERIERYTAKQNDQRLRQFELVRLRGLNCQTTDFKTIRLWANGEHEVDLRLARENGAVGVGLYRTEFLFLEHGKAPTEDQQFEDYRKAVLALEGLPLTIRTLDIGADKKLPLGQNPNEANPALGLRGIRLSLSFPEMFRAQLRAILRAAHYGPVKLLLPMLGQVSDIVRTRALIAESQFELENDGIACGKNLPLGGMIEVPAAAITAHILARELDFLSIGTNDLTQYTLAVDRGNEWLEDWYNPLHPAVLQLISQTIDAGKAAGKPVSLCGEMAGEARYTRLLLALGLTDFSMHPRVLLEVHEAISRCDFRRLGQFKHDILSGEHDDVLRLLAD